jgi:hypothetical protein
MREKLLFAFVLLAGVAAAPRPAIAGCTSDLSDCYVRAANIDGFWERWAAGIDCELDYADCIRNVLIGA